MTALTSGLVRLVGAGLICGFLLSLGGKGPGREILRFACAALMVILLLTTLQNTKLVLPDLSLYEAELESQVQDAQQAQRRELLVQTQLQLAEEVRLQAWALSLDCTAQVACRVDDRDVVRVEQVTVLYRSGPQEALSALRQTLCQLLAVPAEQIIIREDEPS